MEDHKRFHNFSKAEIDLLATLVEKYQHIIECKKSDAVTWKQKNDAWEELTSEFNKSSLSQQERSSKNLKEKWKNVKKDSKKKFADEKQEVYKTGGGMLNHTAINDTDLKIKSIVGVAVTGLPNPFDSDGPLMPLSDALNINDIEITVEKDTEEDIISMLGSNEATAGPGTSHGQNWGTWTPASLKQPKSLELCTTKAVTPKRQKRTQLTDECRVKIKAVSEAKLELTKLQTQCQKEEHEMKKEEHCIKIQQLKEVHNLEIEKKKLEIEYLKNKLNFA